MELKLTDLVSLAFVKKRSNRTFMELKHHSDEGTSNEMKF